MVKFNSTTAQGIVNAMNAMVLQPGFGAYPQGYRAGAIAFGGDESALAPRRPIIAVDGSPQSCFRAEEPHTFRAQIEGMSLVSRDQTGRGLFAEIRSLEKRLNAKPRDIYRLAPETADAYLEEFRSGFAVRMNRYGDLSVRDAVRRACQSATLPNEERISEFGRDLLLISGLLNEEGHQSAPELFFTAGVLLAASGRWAADVASNAFRSAAGLFFEAGRPNAAAVTGELALQLMADSGITPERGDSFAALPARAWLASAEEFASDRSAAMIARSRGMASALSAGEFGIAARLYVLDAVAAEGGVEKGRGFARAAWALSRAAAEGASSAAWSLVAEKLEQAAESWKGADGLARERDDALQISGLIEREGRGYPG